MKTRTATRIDFVLLEIFGDDNDDDDDDDGDDEGDEVDRCCNLFVPIDSWMDETDVTVLEQEEYCHAFSSTSFYFFGRRSCVFGSVLLFPFCCKE